MCVGGVSHTHTHTHKHTTWSLRDQLFTSADLIYPADQHQSCIVSFWSGCGLIKYVSLSCLVPSCCCCLRPSPPHLHPVLAAPPAPAPTPPPIVCILRGIYSAAAQEDSCQSQESLLKSERQRFHSFLITYCVQ